MTQAILPRVIGAIGAADFAAVTAGALCEFLGFDLTAVFLHCRSCAPSVVFDNFALVDAKLGVDNYIRSTHKINPMLGRAGVCRARDFALDPSKTIRSREIDPHVVRTPEEELGFRTVGWPRRQEEICLHFEGQTGHVELGFYRERGRRVAPARKIRELQALSAPIEAAFARHEALVACDRPQPSFETRSHVGVLSPREREICDLMLMGCSSTAIALRLNISRHTVKDHRKHIFRKLQVGSLAELFALRS
jgi:DNA-binding CsgD family transcriptional regulator